MEADIITSPENDASDVDCSVEECYPCCQWLSRLGQSRNSNRHADVKVTRKKKKIGQVCLGLGQQVSVLSV